MKALQASSGFDQLSRDVHHVWAELGAMRANVATFQQHTAVFQQRTDHCQQRLEQRLDETHSSVMKLSLNQVQQSDAQQTRPSSQITDLSNKLCQVKKWTEKEMEATRLWCQALEERRGQFDNSGQATKPC